ncbi:hypothetical protein NQ318_021961 [Aromia moschata]|uniref:Uncharacterized protein n=1 Tax=Aromia moschata TaxID=1265417 RepID=A0AAV8XVU1_9CUCU|nr:hypothetical protein NQ318_021961 [Aromia moschata]
MIVTPVERHVQTSTGGQIVFFALCLAVLAEANERDQNTIVRQQKEVNSDGTHSYLFETGNGIYEDRQGYPKSPHTQALQGQFQYVSPEGKLIYLSYVADENGFQPQGDHIPTPPSP